ncbi:MAG: AbrB/MazE/SpoVT family DNA-binding domain-containing protein [Gemmatimonadales bacterium]|nr:AbrB/MazE/SpoVT family DNA-binding domain-containing protein [Gemmatimonadales bacterium]
MRTRLIRIGNSRGVRLPKPVLQQAGLVDEVEIRVEPGAITIAAVGSPRAGWAAAAAGVEPAGLLDAATATTFDERDWTW